MKDALHVLRLKLQEESATRPSNEAGASHYLVRFKENTKTQPCQGFQMPFVCTISAAVLQNPALRPGCHYLLEFPQDLAEMAQEVLATCSQYFPHTPAKYSQSSPLIGTPRAPVMAHRPVLAPPHRHLPLPV